MLGKSVEDLQTGITVGNNTFTGTLNYVTGYTGFSSKTEEQSGNYLAFHCEADEADSITVEIEGSSVSKGEIPLDSDGIFILRVVDKTLPVKIRAYKDGNVANVKTYSLAGLTLSEG